MITDVVLALAICAFLSCWIGALFYAKAKRASWADPVIQFLAFFALFVLPLPLRALVTHEIEGDVTKHLPQLLPYLPASVLLAALAIVCFIAAYYSSAGIWLAQRLPRIAPVGRDPYWAVIILGAISLFLIARLAREAGGVLGFLLLGYGSNALTFGQGYLAIGFPWLFVALTFLLYRYALHRKTRDLMLYGVGFTTIAAMQLLLGNRSVVLYMVLVTILFVHDAVRRVRLVRLSVLAISAFLVLNVVGFLRASHYTSVADAAANWQESFQNLSNEGGLKHGLFYTLTTGEFVVPFETMPQMIRSVGTEIPPQWGRSFATSTAFFIPSVLFPTRPLPLTNWYMQQFYGEETYGLSEGRAFFFLSEGYLNFGPIGVPLLALLWGVLWRASRMYVTCSERDLGAALLYALAGAFMFRLIAGDFRSLLVGVAEQDLVPAILGLIIIGGWRKRIHTNPSPLLGA